MRPFAGPPLPVDYIEEEGAYLSFDRFTVDIGAPSDYTGDESWADVFDDLCVAAGHPGRSRYLRIGGGYPVYVQGEAPLDDPGFVAQLSTASIDLSPQHYYLFHFGGNEEGDPGNDSFQQLMQMT